MKLARYMNNMSFDRIFSMLSKAFSSINQLDMYEHFFNQILIMTDLDQCKSAKASKYRFIGLKRKQKILSIHLI